MKALWKGQGTLVAHYLLRPRRVAPPLESFYKFMNLNPEPSMTWDFLHIHSGV